MRNKFCTLALTGFLTMGLTGVAALAQDQTATPPAQDQTTAPPESQNNMHHMRHGKHQGMNSDRQLERMTRKLDLSADQQSQVKPILDSQHQQMQELWQDKSMSKADRRAKMNDIQQDTSTKIEAVLNDTQKQKYEAMQSKKKERMMNHHKNMHEQQQPQGTAPETPESPQA